MTSKTWRPGQPPTDYRFMNLSGHLYGRWSVVGYAGRGNRGEHHWHCACSCGTTGVVKGSSLRNGGSQSCGCLRDERTSAAKKIHGQTGSPEYVAWSGMHRRCYYPHHNRFHYYGGAGIVVCDRWTNGDGNLSGFECFLADMGLKPSPDHSIDRKQNSGNYEKDNCRWATRSEQMRNRRPHSEWRKSLRVLLKSVPVISLPDSYKEAALARLDRQASTLR